MLKEQYFTEQNAKSKVKQWEKQLCPYRKRGRELNLQNSALLIIDMQNYFLDKKSHAFVPASSLVVKNIKKVLSFYRKECLPVIFTYFAVTKSETDPILKWWGDTVYEGSIQSRIIRELRFQSNEIVIRKRSYSAFYKTKLEQILKSKKIKEIVITGVLTNLCCETTARDAFARGFQVFFPADATAAYTEEMHLATLKNLSYGFATPFFVEKLLKNDL
ncbi:isochorismatase family protein [Candidatus Woesearchaeota archaeon]|nr:isochorismatase family protein [Candidatus Woesearchaeota archaeon]